MSLAAATAVTLSVLAAGSYAVAMLDQIGERLVGGTSKRIAPAAPLRRAAQLLGQQRTRTERPDATAWHLAAAVFFALAAAGLALVPAARDVVVVDAPAGIVVWGAVEALTVIAVFLHGWAPNSLLPLIGGYRFVAIGLSIMLVSMFVLIAAALPAQSLNLTAIVDSQRGLWNVVRQPLGLPLFLLLGLAISLRGPLDYADCADLAGGTSAEDSGTLRLAWQLARASMLVAFSAMAATVFLGGYLGPLLPGPLWLAIKMALLLVVLVAATHVFARLDPSRMLSTIWLVLLPLSFLDLVIAGVATLS